VALREYVIWCIVLKTGFAGGAHLGNTLSFLTGGTFDILDVKVWGANNTQQGGGTFQVTDSVAKTGITLNNWDVKAQRKLTNDERIVALFGIMANEAAGFANTNQLQVTGTTFISALWQRTLR